MRCTYCNGLGMIYVFVGWQECPSCSGSDPEIFCNVCAAGIKSSEHQEKCLTTNYGGFEFVSMGEVDRYYDDTYVLPYCTFCKQDYLTYNTYMVYQVELFCANENCEAFLKGYWVDKKDLEKR